MTLITQSDRRTHQGHGNSVSTLILFISIQHFRTPQLPKEFSLCFSYSFTVGFRTFPLLLMNACFPVLYTLLILLYA